MAKRGTVLTDCAYLDFRLLHVQYHASALFVTRAKKSLNAHRLCPETQSRTKGTSPVTSSGWVARAVTRCSLFICGKSESVTTGTTGRSVKRTL